MTVNREKLIHVAKTARQESRVLDFKREFDLNSSAAWCELIKDVVAFANSGGGVILFGVQNDGTTSGIDCSALLAYDLANVTNKIFSYSGVQFDELEGTEVERSDGTFPALLIAGTDIPIVFAKPGTYDVGGGKQKTAFSQGTIYFRHGAKSEPGDSNDLAKWRDRELSAQRKSLLAGVKKVVSAPPGTSVSVVEGPVSPPRVLSRIAAKIMANPNAPRVAIYNTDEVWPYRRKELLKLTNARLPKGIKISAHDVVCINRYIDALNNHPEFIHRPHKLASPQYSETYVDWLVTQASTNSNFFAECRAALRH